MMGRSHALSGVAVGMAGAAALGVDPGMAVFLGCLTGGAAVRPDIDHPDSTVSQTFGPITWAFAQIVRRVSGGHRNGTHSALGVSATAVAGFAALALHTGDVDVMMGGLAASLALMTSTLPVRLKHGPAGQAYKTRAGGIAAAGCVAAAVLGWLALAAMFGAIVGTITLAALMILDLSALARAMRIPGVWDDLAPWPVVYALFAADTDLSLVPWAMTAGALVHIVGDSITKGGVPWAWPLSQANVGPQWWLTGGRAEGILVALFVAGIAASVWWLVSPLVGLGTGVVLASLLTATKPRKRGTRKTGSRPAAKKKPTRRRTTAKR